MITLPAPKYALNTVWKVFLHSVLVTGLELNKAVILKWGSCSFLCMLTTLIANAENRAWEQQHMTKCVFYRKFLYQQALHSFSFRFLNTHWVSLANYQRKALASRAGNLAQIITIFTAGPTVISFKRHIFSYVAVLTYICSLHYLSMLLPCKGKIIQTLKSLIIIQPKPPSDSVQCSLQTKLRCRALST